MRQNSQIVLAHQILPVDRCEVRFPLFAEWLSVLLFEVLRFALLIYFHLVLAAAQLRVNEITLLVFEDNVIIVAIDSNQHLTVLPVFEKKYFFDLALNLKQGDYLFALSRDFDNKRALISDGNNADCVAQLVVLDTVCTVDHRIHQDLSLEIEYHHAVPLNHIDLLLLTVDDNLVLLDGVLSHAGTRLTVVAAGGGRVLGAGNLDREGLRPLCEVPANEDAVRDLVEQIVLLFVGAEKDVPDRQPLVAELHGAIPVVLLGLVLFLRG